MKCKICKQKTDWDSSVGRPCFIVCNNCVEKLSKNLINYVKNCEVDKKYGELAAMTAIILNIGYKMEENKKEE